METKGLLEGKPEDYIDPRTRGKVTYSHFYRGQFIYGGIMLLSHFSAHFPCSIHNNSRMMRWPVLASRPDEFLDLRLREEDLSGSELMMISIDKYFRKRYGTEAEAIGAVDEALRKTFHSLENFTKSNNPQDYMPLFEIATPIYRELYLSDKFIFDNFFGG